MYRRTSILDGYDVLALKKRLLDMQAAYLDLMSGRREYVASYAQGDGSKSVTYTQANLADLTQAILALQSQIDALEGNGGINRRRPMRPIW